MEKQPKDSPYATRDGGENVRCSHFRRCAEFRDTASCLECGGMTGPARLGMQYRKRLEWELRSGRK